MNKSLVKKYFVGVIIGLGISLPVLSQDTDSTSYTQINFIKFNQANDLFTIFFQSDKYFSDGMNFEMAFSFLNNKVSDIVLLGFKNTPYKDFTMNFNQDIFTPTNTALTTVDSTDRPYAGQLYVTYAKYSNQFFKGRKLVSKVYIGIQGPAAFGKEVQNGVHSVIKNNEVMGWDNQLSNGLIIDYEMQFLQMIPVSSSFTELHAYGTVRTGTLNSLAEIGLRFKIGRYTDSYMNLFGINDRKNQHNFTAADMVKMSKARRKIIPKRVRMQSLEAQAQYLSNKMNRKLQFYAYLEGAITYMIRDGSVEGSLIQFSPNKYEFSYSDYEHILPGGRYGFVMQYDGFSLEYQRYLRIDSYKKDAVFGYGRIIMSWIF